MTIPDHKGFYTGEGPGAFIISTYGFDALDKALKRLPRELQEKCIEKALKAGGKEIIPAIQKNIISREMGLRRSISQRTNKKTGTNCLVQIGAFLPTHRMWTKSGYKMVKPFYAHMVEWGTNPHAIVPKGKQWGRFPVFGKWVSKKEIKGTSDRRPFSRGFDEKKTAFLWKFGDYVDKYLTKYFYDNCLRKTW